MALSLLLIVAAGLFVRTFSRLANVRLGFARDQVLVVDVNAMRSRVDPAHRVDLYSRLAEAVSAVPGVVHAAASVVTPVSGSSWGFTVSVPGAPEMTERERNVYLNIVTPGWFSTYGTRLIAGRDMDTRDTKSAPRVAIILLVIVFHQRKERTVARVARLVNGSRCDLHALHNRQARRLSEKIA